MPSVRLFGVFQVFLSATLYQRTDPIGVKHSVLPLQSLELYVKISENIACMFLDILEI